MGFFKTLFGGKEENPEEKKKRDDARDFEVLRDDGVRALRSGQAAYAVKCFRKALEIRDELQIHDYLSQALIRADELRPAMQELHLLAEAEPDNIQIFITMARVAYMMEDYQAMNEACEKATLIDSDNAEVVFLYGRASLGQQDLVNAVAMFTKAIMLNDKHGDAYLQRGETLLRMGDLEGAEEDADHLLAEVPDHEDVLLLKARVLMAQKRYEEATEVYSRVIDGNPFCATAYKERGAAYMALNQKDAAEADMRKMLELNPNELADVSGSFSAEGVEQKVRQIYKNNDVFGIFSS